VVPGPESSCAIKFIFARDSLLLAIEEKAISNKNKIKRTPKNFGFPVYFPQPPKSTTN